MHSSAKRTLIVLAVLAVSVRASAFAPNPAVKNVAAVAPMNAAAKSLQFASK